MIFAFQLSINAQVEITFSFDHGQVTGIAPNEFYEFDIMASASAPSQFYIAQVYVDYNTSAFGSSISGTVDISRGLLLADVTTGGFGGYTLIPNDNSPSKLSISNTHVFFGPDGYSLSNPLSITPIVYAHVKIQILDNSQNSEISFDGTVIEIDQQQRYYSTPATSTIELYSPVTFGSGLNNPLPVELISFSVNSVNDTKAQLEWETATEVNNYGFEIERAVKMETEEENPDDPTPLIMNWK